jgi:hypothetical protein
MSKSPRLSVRKLSSFDIRSIPKKPPVPSLNRRRSKYGNLSTMASYFQAGFSDSEQPIATPFSFKNSRCASTAKPARQAQAQ